MSPTATSRRGIPRQESCPVYTSQTIPDFLIPPTLQKRSSCTPGPGTNASCDTLLRSNTIVRLNSSMVRTHCSPVAKIIPQCPKTAPLSRARASTISFFNNSVPAIINSAIQRPYAEAAEKKQPTAIEKRALFRAANRKFFSTEIPENTWFKERYGIRTSNSEQLIKIPPPPGGRKIGSDKSLHNGLRGHTADRKAKSLGDSVVSVLIHGSPQRMRTATNSAVEMQAIRRKKTSTCCLPCLKLYHKPCTRTSVAISAAACTILILLIGCLFMALLFYLNRDNIDLTLLKFW